MADPDELWSMRNNFYVGCYEACITEGELARLDDKPHLVVQRDVFAARAHLALKDFARVAQITSTGSALDLRAVRECATVLNPATPPDAVAAALTKLKGLVEQDATGNETLRVMTGVAFAHVGDANESLRALRAGPGAPSLEALHLQTMAYVRMDRIDAARRTLELMQGRDEDSTLTQLASAWVALGSASGPGADAAVREARYIVEELIGKWQATPLLTSALATALIHQGSAADALKHLDEAYKAYPGDATLAFDRIVAAELAGRPTTELLEQLRRADPKHQLFADLARLATTFDQAAAAFKAGGGL